ncbi:MAG: Na+/Pi-cotransporter [bacterium ADurb.Bin236]|nr:MAG: Na+/Pi-cotransporter [bacterium ADurb.Bin236]HOY63442.1 Na/Pi cotransporter family protein [bacterium]
MNQIDWSHIVFNLLGGLGIFLFGIKTMSSGMQQLAGNRIKRTFDKLTNNRFVGLLVGLSVTALIQSSSATTVMIVGFINAGLMELSSAVGIILGANIGTTITSWIIVIKITRYAMPIVGIGAILALFSKNKRVKTWGEALLGFGLLFMGLKLMETAFMPLRENEQFISFFAQFGAGSFSQILKSVLAGLLLTMIVQSSSATVGITIALANQGLLTYEAAAALVLGENIGTTITMELASIGANISAKRAARIHTLFNVIGVTYMVFIFPFYIRLIDYIVPGGMNHVAADGTRPYIAAHIAAGHSVFNIFNSLVFLFAAGLLIKLVTWLIPGDKDKSDHKLEYIDYSFISAPAIALGQSKKEIIKMSGMVIDMFKWNSEMLVTPALDHDKVERLFKYENITDSLQAEISKFLAQLLQSSPGPDHAEEARRYLRVTDELESIGDYCEQLAKYCVRKEQQNVVFTESASQGLLDSHRELLEYLEMCMLCFIEEKARNRHEADSRSKSLQKTIKRLKDDHVERLNKGECDVVPGLLYNDILTAFQKIRSHSHNIAEAIIGLK